METRHQKTRLARRLEDTGVCGQVYGTRGTGSSGTDQSPDTTLALRAGSYLTRASRPRPRAPRPCSEKRPECESQFDAALSNSV